MDFYLVLLRLGTSRRPTASAGNNNEDSKLARFSWSYLNARPPAHRGAPLDAYVEWVYGLYNGWTATEVIATVATALARVFSNQTSNCISTFCFVSLFRAPTLVCCCCCCSWRDRHIVCPKTPLEWSRRYLSKRSLAGTPSALVERTAMCGHHPRWERTLLIFVVKRCIQWESSEGVSLCYLNNRSTTGGWF